MSFKCGIVGLPNVGKSTLFNALTNSSKAQAANFPFCTIDPNVGVVPGEGGWGGAVGRGHRSTERLRGNRGSFSILPLSFLKFNSDLSRPARSKEGFARNSKMCADLLYDEN